jgi:isochorismate hydrolase
VKDATADYSEEMMHAALDINMPNYASAIVSTEEIVAAIATPLYSMKNSCWLYFVS